MKKLQTALLAILLALSTGAFAISLDDARDNGYVVEMPDGYIKAQPGATAEVEQLVKEVNEKRLEVYKQIAEKHGVSVEQVAAESYRKRTSGGQ